MEKLSINDKSDILWIRSINNNFLVWDKRQIIIFEYLAKFEESFLFKYIYELWMEFQVKIKKELIKNKKDDFLNSEYIDLKRVERIKNDDYSIILEESKEEELKTTKIGENDLNAFISTEKGEEYIYRHFIIINIPRGENIHKLTYDFINQIQDSWNIIRLLKRKEIKEYLQDELKEREKSKYNLENDWFKIKKRDFILNPSKTSHYLTKKISKILDISEKSFFQSKIIGIDNDILEILNTETIKTNNSIINWGTHIAWLYIKWLPKDNFNILKYLFLYLENWDSITINIYKENKHKTIEEKRGLSRLNEDNKDNTKDNEENIYLQIVVNIKEINQELLNKKIDNFQLSIWEDIYTQRISWVMSNYFATYIWTWENKLNLEKEYKKQRLIRNLLF